VTSIAMHKERVERWIGEYISGYPDQIGGETRWLAPLVGVASARDPLFKTFKGAIHGGHLLPQDLLPEARSVIVFYVPFTEELHRDNFREEYHCSRSWAIAYIETNRLIADTSTHLKEQLAERGHSAALIPPTHNFDRSTLMSDWSHRHAAYAAGLGRFGFHNLLITPRGCTGRLGSLVTDLELEPSPIQERDFCLFKAGKSCQKCVERCEFGALRPQGFDRFACHRQCRANDGYHSDLPLTEICGKCAAMVPCSIVNPNP
jgi:epoxyqueuosine reductase QueG